MAHTLAFMRCDPWTIAGAGGQPILGNAHMPVDKPRGTVFVLHGFKGYKDYGMFPRIAAELAQAGFAAHRFNFSHSGMTDDTDTFARPDLFERDTWNKQVVDLAAVVRAFTEPPDPYFFFGHSRGGVTALLTAGRFAGDDSFPQPAGVITAAAPATACSLNEEDQQRLLRDGFLESRSSRTGQSLRIGKAFLQEQFEDSGGHDVLAMVRRIRCPLLILHGESDPTVPAAAAHELANASGGTAALQIIPNADHVFNTPNPLPADAQVSPQLRTVIDSTLNFVGTHAEAVN